MRKRCIKCGAEYDGVYSSTLCPTCAAASKAGRVIRDRVCRLCGRTFPGGPRAWYCPECRIVKRAEADHRGWLREVAGRVRRIGSTDNCEVCGKPYTVNGSNQRYCPECALEAVRKVDREQSRAWNAANVDIGEKRIMRALSIADIPCQICGKIFTPELGAKMCSDECRKEYMRRYAAEYERKQARKEYKRAAYRAKIEAMSADELREYRDKANTRARENYKARKQRTSDNDNNPQN